MLKKISFLLLLLLTLLSAKAQQSISVKASIDSTSLMIGQQTLYHLDVSGPVGLRYIFPFFGDTLTDKVMIVQKSKLDTIHMNDQRIDLRMDYLITSFDSGLYYLPPVKILAGKDSVESNYLSLKVITLDVDTTKMQYYDIKGAQKPPFVLSDYMVEFMLFLLVYALVLTLIWFRLRKKYPRDKVADIAPELLLPPHIVALMELDKLRSEKIWKQGKNKRYFTELSDVLRRYIERRFQINALEMTTEEILTIFKRDKTTQSVYQNLSQILQLADLVKFAKIEPLESENELSIMNSYLFINQTKLEEVKSIDEQKEELNKESENTQEPESAATIADDELKKYMPK